jgi:hypothetical protein
MMLFFSELKGWGVVATEDIEAGTMVSIYGGEYIMDSEGNESSDYYFALEFGDLMTEGGFDASRFCNIARFVNGVCTNSGDGTDRFEEPNIMPLNVVATMCDTATIGLFSRRKVYRGEEMLIYYGPFYEGIADCKCNECLRRFAQRSEADPQRAATAGTHRARSHRRRVAHARRHVGDRFQSSTDDTG